MEKEEKKEIQKFEYLENKESFLNELKTIICNSLKAIIWLKKWTQALKIFFSKFDILKLASHVVNTPGKYLVPKSLVIIGDTLKFCLYAGKLSLISQV